MTSMMASKRFCGTCNGHYEVRAPEGDTPVAVLEDLLAAQEEADDAHRQWHADNPGIVHARRQVARKRGDGFYKVQYGSAEDGSMTLCGAPAGTADLSYGETRHASRLAYVTCDDCKRIRTEGK
jgi:hypothetical protein